MKRVRPCLAVAIGVSLSACDKKPADHAAAPAAAKPAQAAAAKPQSPPAPAVMPEPAVAPPPVATRPEPVVPAAFSAALALGDEAAREEALRRAVMNVPPASAADLLLARLPADALRAKLLGEVLVKLAIQEPAAAARWLDKAGDIPEKPAAVRTTADLWQRQNFAAAIQWIGTLPAGNERPSALQAIAGRIGLAPAEHQDQELSAIPNAAMRAEVESLMHAP
jgi:hypothetical protein